VQQAGTTRGARIGISSRHTHRSRCRDGHARRLQFPGHGRRGRAAEGPPRRTGSKSCIGTIPATREDPDARERGTVSVAMSKAVAGTTISRGHATDDTRARDRPARSCLLRQGEAGAQPRAGVTAVDRPLRSSGATPSRLPLPGQEEQRTAEPPLPTGAVANAERGGPPAGWAQADGWVGNIRVGPT
jgi:hypothetical protein